MLLSILYIRINRNLFSVHLTIILSLLFEYLLHDKHTCTLMKLILPGLLFAGV